MTLTEESQVAGAVRQGVWSPGVSGEGLLWPTVCGPLPRPRRNDQPCSPPCGALRNGMWGFHEGGSLHLAILFQISRKFLDYDREHDGLDVYKSNRQKKLQFWLKNYLFKNLV